MGNTLGSIFSGSGAGANGAPSLTQNLAQGTAKGAGTAFGKGMQQKPMPGGAQIPGAPSATPVDASFFAPSSFGSNPPQSVNPNALYGR